MVRVTSQPHQRRKKPGKLMGQDDLMYKNNSWMVNVDLYWVQTIGVQQSHYCGRIRGIWKLISSECVTCIPTVQLGTTFSITLWSYLRSVLKLQSCVNIPNRMPNLHCCVTISGSKGNRVRLPPCILTCKR